MKEEEFRKKIENIYYLQQEKIAKKQKELKLKEEIQKRNLEEIKKEREIETR